MYIKSTENNISKAPFFLPLALGGSGSSAGPSGCVVAGASVGASVGASGCVVGVSGTTGSSTGKSMVTYLEGGTLGNPRKS